MAILPARSNKFILSPLSHLVQSARGSFLALLWKPMNFDDALEHYAPRAWFRFKFLEYKYRKRGEPEIHLIRHLVAPGPTALDIAARSASMRPRWHAMPARWSRLR
jgi:hypothetical protein